MKKLALLLTGSLFLALGVEAADWPQWQGPNRNNINPEKGLLATFPAGGPKQLWAYTDCGVGFSSPTVRGERLYLLGSRGQDEVLHCLDVKTGKPAWANPVVVGPLRDVRIEVHAPGMAPSPQAYVTVRPVHVPALVRAVGPQMRADERRAWVRGLAGIA